MSRPNEGQAGPPRATATRRPLLSTFEGNNRAILQGIRDNLSHVLNKSQEEGGAPQSPGAGGEPGTPQGRRAAGGDRLSETGSSARAGAEGGHQQGAGAGAGLQTPNTSGSTAASAAHHNKRLAYNQKALASIRQALSGFHKDEPPNGTSGNTVGKNGFNEVDPQMLDKLISMGYPEEAARTILRTHGNKIDAQYLLGVGMGNKAPHPDSGRNGFNKTHAGLAPYPRPVTRKPSFEEKYRTNSPVNSENSSVRSDSPSHAQLRQNVASSAKTSATSQLFPGGHPNYSMLVPQGVGDRHTPPPLPPRGLPANDLPQEVYIDSPPYPSDAGGFKNQQLVRDMILKRTELPNNMRPQTAQGRPISNGPVTSHRGRPVSAPTHQGNHHNHLYNQQVVQGNNQIVLGNHQHLVAANQPPVMHGNNQVVYGNPGQVVSGSHGQVVQSSNMAGAEGVRHAYTQQFTRSGLNSQVPINSLERLHLHDDGSPLSSHSPSPAPTPVNQGGYRSATQTPIPQLKPVTALPCVQGIVTLQANSHEVTKPQLQEATAPLSPPIHPRQEYHQQPGRMVDEQQNYVSSVQAEVNQRQQQQQLQQQQHMSAASLHHQQQQQQLQQQQFQQQQYHQQQQQIQQQQYQQQQYLAERTQSPVDRQQYPVTRGSIQIDMQQQRYAGQAGLQGYPRGVPNPGPANPANSGRTIQINIQNQAGQQHAMHIQHHNAGYSPFGTTPLSTPRSESPVPRTLNQSPAMSVISTTSTPSTNSDIPDKPPPPYPGRGVNTPMYPHNQMRPLLEEKPPPAPPSESGSESLVSTDRDDDNSSVSSEKLPSTKPRKSVVRVMSPRPDRKPEARRRDPERCETQVQHFSPQAYKFFMEQHVENVLKSYQQREKRRLQLETEMAKVGLSDEAASQMRKMLHQKESNYIRLKRAKMDKHMFDRLKTLGIGAFGEVNLVRKIDTHILFAMKKLRKKDVLRRNQVAHVKAERDILAEAECEWVVKLYYSFQDESNLYFVMDYIPGGDMMSLLIKYGIFPEELARFYIAELVLAIESVHNMGFIHRDIKPDNILIDKDGHIKLTDFGLCTGFRWTHNSKYYQKSNHPRQDSMEPDESWIKDNCHCDKDLQKPLVRRNIRHQRCLAHSLVGTPNYIAPEVLLRSANIQTEPGGPEGYTKICDWWSVGVILYEMLVGQPPFLANTPIETQYKVIHWQETLQIPTEANMSGSARDLILKLLRSPHNRLGQQGATEMKNHPFFSAIDFKDLRQQAAPHKPQIRYPTDTSNFDPVEPERLKSSNDDTLKKEGTFENGKHPEHAFLEFTFRRFFDEGGHVYAPRHSDMDESNSPVYV